jgi:hypothetical protein
MPDIRLVEIPALLQLALVYLLKLVVLLTVLVVSQELAVWGFGLHGELVL